MPIPLRVQGRALEASLHAAAYDGLTFRRRLRAAGGVALLAAALLLACWVAEVRPGVFVSHFGRLFDYLSDLLHLDSGDPVWTRR